MPQRFTNTHSAGRVSIQISGDDASASARVLHCGKYIGICACGTDSCAAETALITLLTTLVGARHNLTLHYTDALSLAELYVKTVKENTVP